ncbi:MAG: tetratricopeptide repeat protein [Candidatus Marinimicrobia bacterium]|nr:tetratricopeptide repeat protein [Candidatus Neomarinimicrobiota bacterium]
MSEQSRLSSFIEELRRRRVFRVAAVYGGVAFVLFQIIDSIFEPLHIPEWIGSLIIILLLVGFPLAMGLAWIFDITPEGIVRTKGRSSGKPGTSNRVLIAVTIAAVAFGIWGLWGGGKYEGSVTGAEYVKSVAVLPFSVQGTEEYAYLGAGMVDLMSTKLDGGGEWRSIDPRAVLGYLDRRGATNPDPQHGRDIARYFDADLFVLGNIVAVGARLHLDASLYDPLLGMEAVARGTAEGDADQIFGMVDELVSQLLVGQIDRPGGRFRQVAGMTTASLPALKAYLEGEHAMRSGLFETARSAFELALSEDSLYALADYRLSIAAEFLTRMTLAQTAAERAYRHADRLSDHDRQLLEAFLLWRQGAHGEAERLYRSILGTYPEDIEAWMQLGEIQFHTNVLHGRATQESAEAFERVLALEPNHTTAMLHLIRLFAIHGELAAMDSVITMLIALSPAGDRSQEIQAIQALSHGNRQDEDRMIADLSGASELELIFALWVATTWTENVPGAMRLAGLMTNGSRSVEARRVGHIALAQLHMVRGHWQAARSELQTLKTVDAVAALEYEALFSLIPFLPVENQRLQSLRADLEILNADDIPPSNNPSSWFNMHDEFHPMLKSYLLGLIHVRLGDTRQAGLLAEQLAVISLPIGGGSLATDMAHSIVSYIHLEKQETADALTALEQMRSEMWYILASASPFGSQALERFRRAELLGQLGRDREALQWYKNLVGTSGYERVFSPIAHLRSGEIYERLGDLTAAREHYARFVELWQDCDPELRPLLEDARQRLAELARATTDAF